MRQPASFDCDHQPQGSQPTYTHNTSTKQEPSIMTQELRPYNASRLMTLLQIMDDHIKAYNVIGIAIWSAEALNCMFHIEVDNGIYRPE